MYRNDHIYIYTSGFVLILWIHLIGGSCGSEVLLQCPRCNERGKEGDCRASWKYELTKGGEVLPSPSLCPSASRKAWLKIFLSHSISSIYFLLTPSIPPSLTLFLSLSPLVLLSHNSLISTYKRKLKFPFTSCHTARLLPTNGSMQLACTHSKRPFEYSSANSCIHWYLKCSGFARALNSRCIWLNLKNEQRGISGIRIKTVLFCAASSNTNGQAHTGMCLCLFPSQKIKGCTLSIFTATYW